MTHRHSCSKGLIWAVLAAFAAVSALAQEAGFPSPDLGIANLSVCKDSDRVRLTKPEPLDLAEFAHRLHGTWKLKTRTIQGITIDTNSKFYFDIKSIGADSATGTAMMIDRGNLNQLDPMKACPHCKADASVGAFWKVNMKRKSPNSVFLSMAGEYLGSYGDFQKGITATEEAEFFKQGGVFVAGNLISPAGGQGLPDDVWDTIGLTDSVLTYVSCKSGFVDRFEKISGDNPTVDGRSLEEDWAKHKKEGSLVHPPHIESEKHLLR